MPKAPARKKASAARKEPTQKSKPKDPKASHLYTDDNPATTIHGTGFKDKTAALRTLDFISQRSLTYQFQTVNTMYHRAKHHPSMKTKVDGSAGLSDMTEAMDIFRHWLDETYPAEKDGLRASGFKPLLSKNCVERYLSRIEENQEVGRDAKRFARVYANLPKGKRLGNVLLDDSKPTEPDWERKRYDTINDLVSAGKEGGPSSWNASELWSEDQSLSTQHIELVAWAWSPVGESKLV